MADQRQLGIREVTSPTMDGRMWEVVVAPDDIRFRVTATGRSLAETPQGATPLGCDWSEEEIQVGLHAVVEKELVSPRSKMAGMTYELNLTSHDLYEANGRL